MISVSVSHDLGQLQRKIRDLRVDQLPFATARALTATANVVKAEMPNYLERVLAKPKPFTKSGMFVTPATKANQQAVVGFKDLQARYLAPLLAGSPRNLKPSEQRFMGRYFVPARAMPTDSYGNVTKANLLALLKAAQEKGAFKGRRVIVVTESSASFTPGVYLGNRMNNRRAEGMTPLLIFVNSPPRYRKLIDLPAEVKRTVRARFPDEFRAAYAAAVASAR